MMELSKFGDRRRGYPHSVLTECLNDTLLFYITKPASESLRERAASSNVVGPVSDRSDTLVDA
jgi:hypothetical protein